MTGSTRVSLLGTLALGIVGIIAFACTGVVTQPGEVAMGGPPRATDQAAASALRRLSRREYENALTEVFGTVASGLPARHLPLDVTEPYDTDMTHKAPSDVFVGGMESLAFDLATAVSADRSAVDALCGCAPSGPSDDASLRLLAERVGLRLFRRPLTEDELTPLLETARGFATSESDFYVGARFILQALIESPEFVYRLEIGTPDGEVQRLGSYELVTRLSFLIWGTTPDEALLAEAAASPTMSGDDLAALASEMLEDPRADAQIRSFHALWLGYRNLRVSAELAPSMLQESEALLDRVLIEERLPWSTLFTSDSTYLDPLLAEHYGMPAITEPGWVTYHNPDRAGIISHGSFLSLSSRGDDTSPTLRGKLIATRLLCWTIPDPPPEVNPDLPPERAETECKIDAYAQHRDSSTQCFACHQMMDPIGFGLERFDGLGRYRTTEYENTSCEVSGEGSVSGYGVFNGPRQLATMLVEEGLLTSCGVQQFLHFSTGRAQTPADHRLIDRLDQRFVESGEDFRELILGFVRDPVFQVRIEEAAP